MGGPLFLDLNSPAPSRGIQIWLTGSIIQNAARTLPKIKLKVLESNKQDQVKTKVVVPGVLSSFKGVNLPNTKISFPCLTPKDKKDYLLLSLGGASLLA